MRTTAWSDRCPICHADDQQLVDVDRAMHGLTVTALTLSSRSSCVGRITIDFESFRIELACQRQVKARAQVADEALNLALGFRLIRPAQPRHEAMMMREVEEGAVVAMQPRSVAIPSVATVRMLS